MRLARLLGFALFSVCVNNSSAAEAVWYARIAGIGYSEAVAFRQLTSDWSGRFSPGDSALQHLKAETGVEYGKWGLGTFVRDDGEARFKSDTAIFYYLLANRQPLEPGRHYAVELDVEHAHSNGIRLFRKFKSGNWATLSLGTSLFHSDRLISGTMRGTVAATGDKDYEFKNLTVDYYYSRDVLFDREVAAPTGLGLAFDIDLVMTPAPAWTTHLQTENLLGTIFWRSAPFTQARVDTNNKTYDEIGYVHVQPLLSGRQGDQSYRQRLPLLSDLRIDYAASENFAIVGAINYTPVHTFWSAGAALLWGNHNNLTALYTIEPSMLTLSARFAYGYISIGTDQASAAKAHALTIATGVTYPLGDF